MTSVAEMAGGVRAMVRDFPQYFEVEEGPLRVLTIRLPHPLVASGSLQVYVTPNVADATTTLTDKWTLDDRNGILKLTNPAYVGQRVLVSGYHYIWFSDSDVARAMQQIGTEIMYTTPDLELADLDDSIVEVAEMGAVVRLLWSLCIELALDIDVSTPEGMFIPAHQRYSQALQMMQYWEGQYQTRASSLNLGYGALEIFQLRRVARLTNRYVPVYRNQEIDDPRRPQRIYPAIPEGEPYNSVDDNTVEVIDGVEIYQSSARSRYGTTGYYPNAGPGFLGVP